LEYLFFLIFILRIFIRLLSAISGVAKSAIHHLEQRTHVEGE